MSDRRGQTQGGLRSTTQGFFSPLPTPLVLNPPPVYGPFSRLLPGRAFAAVSATSAALPENEGDDGTHNAASRPNGNRVQPVSAYPAKGVDNHLAGVQQRGGWCCPHRQQGDHQRERRSEQKKTPQNPGCSLTVSLLKCLMPHGDDTCTLRRGWLLLRRDRGAEIEGLCASSPGVVPAVRVGRVVAPVDGVDVALGGVGVQSEHRGDVHRVAGAGGGGLFQDAVLSESGHGGFPVGDPVADPPCANRSVLQRAEAREQEA